MNAAVLGAIILGLGLTALLLRFIQVKRRQIEQRRQDNELALQQAIANKEDFRRAAEQVDMTKFRRYVTLIAVGTALAGLLGILATMVKIKKHPPTRPAPTHQPLTRAEALKWRKELRKVSLESYLTVPYERFRRCRSDRDCRAVRRFCRCEKFPIAAKYRRLLRPAKSKKCRPCAKFSGPKSARCNDGLCN